MFWIFLKENGTAIFGPTGRTCQRGPHLEVGHFDRKMSTWTEPFHLHWDGNFRKFWRNGKHPKYAKDHRSVRIANNGIERPEMHHLRSIPERLMIRAVDRVESEY